MIKSLLTFLLITLSSLACLGQIPDSIKINNEWRYIYPVQEEIGFSSYYYYQLGIRGDEFPIWMEWKLADDPRAKLKSKKLHKAIYAEKYKRKEVRDSIPLEQDLTIRRTGVKFPMEETRKGEIYYELSTFEFNNVPPVSNDLPSGKYVQFYESYVTLDKGSKQQKVRNKVCVLFELNNNELDNQFTRFNLAGDTLVNGKYDKSLKVGLWQEAGGEASYSSSFGTYVSIGEYISGVKEGRFFGYKYKKLRSIENYKKGELVGQNIQITYADSIVYDVFQALDVLVDYKQLNEVRNSDFIPKYRDKIELKLLPPYYDFHRISPHLVRSGYSTKYKPISDSSLLIVETGVIRGRKIVGVPLFDTYYKIYDRKTQKLIYSCYLDTVTRQFSGSSWFSNGQRFDTIWTEGTKIHRIAYDLNGQKLNSTLDKKEKPVKRINGFEVSEYINYSAKNESFYDLCRSVTRNDTVFDEMEWTRSEKLNYVRFHLVNDSILQELIYTDEGLIHHEKAKDRYVTTYKHNGLEVKISEVNQNRSFSIKVNGALYEGPVEISEKYYQQWNLELIVKNKKMSFSSSKMSRHDFFSLLDPRILGFYAEDVLFKKLSGYLKDGQLDGKVILTNYYTDKTSELYYRNGKANGTLTIWKSQPKKNQKEMIRNFGADSTTHFSAKGLKKTFMWKSISLENGVPNGPLVYYFSNGDTSGVIPFKNGLKEGKAFRYLYQGEIYNRPNDPSFGNYRIEKAVFSEDKLVGELLIKEKYLYGSTFDTLVSAAFDEKGVFLNGIENKEQYFDQDAAIFRITFNKRPDGSIDFKKTLYDKITEAGIVYKVFYLSDNEYVNGILNTSKIYEDSMALAFESCITSIIEFKNWEKLSFYYPEFHLSKDEKLRFRLTEGEMMLSGSLSDDLVLKREESIVKREPKKDYYFKKYFPNGVVSREGKFIPPPAERWANRKSGLWKVRDYNGNKCYELNYFDSVVKIGDQQWGIIGLQTDFDTLGNEVSRRWVLFEDPTYQCSSDDYYTERQFITISAADPNKMNGLTKNYYDNGALMNEGAMKNGLPEGLWKFYAPDGKLKRLGRYVDGKQNGKWLTGDLDEKAYIGGVCIDPDDPYYEFNVHSLENDKEIEVTVYKKGEILTSINYRKDKYKEEFEGEEIRSDIELR